MAWKAFLESVSDPTAPGSSLDVSVRFTRVGDGKTFVKGYSLQSGNFPNLAAFKALIAADVQALADFDGTTATIKTFAIGQEIK